MHARNIQKGVLTMVVKKLMVFASVLALLSVVHIAKAHAADWTLFRGDVSATGQVDRKVEIADNLKIAWETRLEKGYFDATPIVVGDSIFIGNSEEGLLAFDLQTGKPKWRHQIANGISASAAYFEGLVFVGDTRGTLHALNAETGEQEWSFNARGTIDNSPNIDIETKRVIIGSQSGTLFALEAATGTLVWEYAADDMIQCFPSIIGRHCFVAGCDGYLHVVDLDTGKRVSRISLDSPTGSTPVLAGDLAFVGTEGNEFLGIDWKKGEVFWRFEMSRGARAPVAYRDGTIIFGGMDRIVYALNARTGEERWRYVTRGRIEGGAVIVGNKVYIPSMDSSLYVLDFQTGRLIESIELTGRLSTSPAVVSNRIIIATDEGVLTCLQGE